MDRSPSRPSTLFRSPAAQLALVVALTIVAYGNSLHGGFVLDDQRCIVESPAVRDLGSLLDPVRSELLLSLPKLRNCGALSRYVGHLSFALNYALGGLDVTGYHVFNLLVHVLNAVLVYVLVRLTVRTPFFAAPRGEPLDEAARAAAGERRDRIAFLAALLFALHPVQTEAVSYVTQRFASLAATFYLLSVLAYLGFRMSSGAPRKALLMAGSVAAAYLGTRTKEMTVTLPVVLAIYEVAFFRGRPLERVLSLVPASLVAALPVVGRISWRDVAEPGRLGATLTALPQLSRADYLFTQFRAIATYLRLVVAPYGQTLDHDFRISHSLLETPVLASAFLLLAIFALAVLALVASRSPRRSDLRLAGVGLLWFFVALSVESSVIPIADVMAEHRVYLPSVGLFTAVAAAAFAALGRLGATPARTWPALAAIVAVAAPLVVLTHARNEVWSDPARLWQEAAAKGPAKRRPHIELSHLYLKAGRYQEAEEEARAAIRLWPDASDIGTTPADAYNSLGVIAKEQGHWDEAMEAYRKAVSLKPTWAEAHYNIAILAAGTGRLADAETEFREALRLSPDYAEAHNNLGVLYARQGRMEEAVREFQAAVLFDPANARARANLAMALGAGER